MKKTLIIGSTVLDMIVKIDKIPYAKEDVHTHSMDVSLGGMAFNVYSIHDHFQIPTILCCAAGEGFFADSVVKLMKEHGAEPFVRINGKDNGCCLCLVESSGERTFISNHGAEYKFDKEWLKDLSDDEFDMIYVSGLEVEEPTGENLIEYLEEHRHAKIFFAPGPRINKIEENKLNRIFKLKPIVHLNDQEVIEYTKLENIKEAALSLHNLTHNDVVVTCGSQGALIVENKECTFIETEKVDPVDTIGAGDSHVATIMAMIKKGSSLKEAVVIANKVSAQVVQTKGAILSKEDFNKVKF